MIGKLTLFILEIALLVWSIYATIALVQAKRLLKGVHEPELWLPRRERRAHARKLLKREDDEYMQQLIEKTTNYIKDGK